MRISKENQKNKFPTNFSLFLWSAYRVCIFTNTGEIAIPDWESRIRKHPLESNKVESYNFNVDFDLEEMGSDDTHLSPFIMHL